MRKTTLTGIFCTAVLIAGMLLAACAKPTPAPAPATTPIASPTPAPTPPRTTPGPAPVVSPLPTPSRTTPTPAPTFVPKLPQKMAFSTLEVGTSGYQYAVGLANALGKQAGTGMTLRVLPIGTNVGRLLSIKTGTAHISVLATEAYAATEGIAEFSAIEWGPQKIFNLLSGVNDMGPVTRADSSIKTLADLKGRNVVYIPGTDSVNVKTEALLAFAGLTWDDVKKIDVPNINAGYDALIQGKLDFMPSSNTTVPKMIELEASPHGIYWIPIPHNDEAGWKRLEAKAPVTGPLFRTFHAPGAGVKPGQKIETYGMRYPQLSLYEGNLSNEEVYAFVKLIDESYEKYIKGTFPGSERFDVKASIKTPLETPLHPGAIRYAKDKGYWTSADDALNNAQLMHLAEVQRAWDTVMAEAVTKGIKSTDFPKYWLKRKAELVK